MKNKLKEYIDLVFADAERRAPGNRRVTELKEEILQNLYEKYDDLIAKGKTPAAAYNIAVAGVGDISGLLDSVCGSGSNHTEAVGQEPPEKGTHGEGHTRPLTPEEQNERAALRTEYINEFRASMTGILDNSVIVRPDGTRESVKDRRKNQDT